MWNTALPVCEFDLTEGDIPRRLPAAVKETLRTAGRPERGYVAELRGYAGQKNLHNQKIIHHFRIARRFVRLIPSREGIPDWTSLYDLIGPSEFPNFIPGETPPVEVWSTRNRLLRTNGAKAIKFDNALNDLIEDGADTDAYYVLLAYYSEPRRSQTQLSPEEREALRRQYIAERQGRRPRGRRIPHPPTKKSTEVPSRR